MSTLTISALPLRVAVADTTEIATETAGSTQKITALGLKTYMTTLPSLVVTGGINGTITTTASAQPNITSVGTLTQVNTSGQIISTLTGFPPLVVASNQMVANLYAQRSSITDNGLTTATFFSNTSSSDDVIISTNSSNVGNVRVTATLKNVNVTPGVWGGQSSGQTYQIPTFTLNQKGLITSAGNIFLNLDLDHQTVTSLSPITNQLVIGGGNAGILGPVGNLTIGLASNVTIQNEVNTTTVNAGGTINGVVIKASSGLYDSGNRVATGLNPTAGAGIRFSGVTTGGPNLAFTVTNTGILSVTAGAGVAVTHSGGDTSNVTIVNTGVTGLSGIGGVTASAANGSVILSQTYGYNGYGVRTVSTGTPTGGSDGDIWYQV